MKVRTVGLCVLAGAAAVVCFVLTVNAAPPEPAKGAAADERVSVAEARERARLMHKIYAATLDVVHHHYFRRDRAVLPARALEDVFAEIDEQAQIKARWIAVNTSAMSINHEPATDFEKKAAAEIAAGKPEYDRVEDGYYRRAGAIPLTAGCVGCHTNLLRAASTQPRFAGLVISIPVKDR